MDNNRNYKTYTDINLNQKDSAENKNEYVYPPRRQRSNTALVVLVTVLSCLLVVIIAALTLVFTGAVSVPWMNSSAPDAVEAVSTAAPAATETVPPAPPAVPAAVGGYKHSANTTISQWKYVANVKYSIYLRSEPIENSGNVICEIPLGTAVGFIEYANSDFAKINYNGTLGYSKIAYLSDYAPYHSYHYSYGADLKVVNVKYSIYLRSTPSEADNNNVIAEIPAGSYVTYLGTPDNTFYEISYNGMVGYSKQIYLEW